MEFINQKAIENMLWNRELVGLLTQIYREVGRLEVYRVHEKNELQKMRQQAREQSIRSVHKIEKITIGKSQLKALLEGGPAHDMDEREILGYINVYDDLYKHGKNIEISPKAILQIHRQLYRYTKNPFAGLTKIMHDPINDQEGQLIAMPIAPVETAHALEELCQLYQEDQNDPLLKAMIFFYDFLCIYPFNDGNIRMSFLLLSLLLRQNGFLIGDYISLEDLVLETIKDYDQALKDTDHDCFALIKYMLQVILKAYQEIHRHLAFMSQKPSALEMVEDAVNKQVAPFTKQDIRDAYPSLSISSVEGGLRHLVASGEIIRQGNGKNTYYIFPLNENG